MKRTIWTSVVLSSVLIGLSLPNTALAGPEKNNVRHTIIAKSGDSAPAGGTYQAFSFFNASMNARGAVAFDSVVGPPLTIGIFKQEGGRTSPVAFGTNPDPDGRSFGSVMNSFITNDGDVVFDGNANEVFRSNGLEAISLVQAGDAEPHAGTLTSLLSQKMVNNRGEIAYFASVSGAAATQGIFRSDGRRNATIVSDDMIAPTGGNFISLQDFRLNNHGEVAFKADLAGGRTDHGIFRGDGEHLTTVFAENQRAPKGGVFGDCGIPEMNDLGQVAVICPIVSGPFEEGLFMGDGRETEAIALNGQLAPMGGNYAILELFKVNDRGEVVFQTRLTSGLSGLFRGNGRHTTTIALTGTKAPGTKRNFDSFGTLFTIGNDNRVVFAATLAPGVDGVDMTNNVGIWAGSSEDDLQLVVRTGDLIDGNLVTNLPLNDTVGHSFDKDGDNILWVGNFGDIRALVVSQFRGEGERRSDEK